MNFGKSVGVACASFAITNIDDMFVLVTFFSEASTSKTITPLKIVLGQYIGFTTIVIISLIGFGVSYLIPTEPIGFLGFMPLLLGVWRFLGLLFPTEEEESERSKLAGIKSILKVSIITLMNGGDNIGTYVPLFSQARKAEIAIYIVIYYILLGVWCLVAFLVMREKHILALAQKYMHMIIPFLYIGLGLYILIKSSCYPWSIQKIEHSVSTHPGKIIMSVVIVFLLLTCMAAMLYFRLKKRPADLTSDVLLEGIYSPTAMDTVDGSHASI
jgi:cadmium resistance protein CadD (predicted permease)